MSDLTIARILDHCQRLGLLHLKNSLAANLSRAETEAWGHVELLDRLLEEELSAREERRIRNALKLAAFPFIKTLDAFDFAFQPSLERARIMDLAALGFLERKENVLLLGPPGVGKTHLAIALAVRACQHGASVYFTSLDQMIRALREADSAGKLSRKLKSYTTKSQLLVLDEVGYLPLTRSEANYFFQVVTARYERSSLILTSNKGVTEWPELFGDTALATATLDRILHHAHVMTFKRMIKTINNSLTRKSCSWFSLVILFTDARSKSSLFARQRPIAVVSLKTQLILASTTTFPQLGSPPPHHLSSCTHLARSASP